MSARAGESAKQRNQSAAEKHTAVRENRVRAESAWRRAGARAAMLKRPMPCVRGKRPAGVLRNACMVQSRVRKVWE